jgi:AmiR/NasT family two-component response regulator
MTVPRLVQNFRGCRAQIVLGETTSIGTLRATLTKLGVSVADPVLDAREIDLAALHPEQDFVFVDGDLQTQVHWQLSPIAQLPPAPVIGLVGVEAPSRLKALVQLGATAFLRKPVHGAAVYSALYIGVNEYRRQRELELRIEDGERRRRGRRYVIKAVLSLVQRRGLDDEAAYELLRRDSMRARQSLEHYCETFVRDAAECEPEALRPGEASVGSRRKEGERG